MQYSLHVCTIVSAQPSLRRVGSQSVWSSRLQYTLDVVEYAFTFQRSLFWVWGFVVVHTLLYAVHVLSLHLRLYMLATVNPP